jgi:lysozyme
MVFLIRAVLAAGVLTLFALMAAGSLDPRLERRGANGYALVIGIEHYERYPDSRGARASAELMARHLSAGGFTLVRGGPLIDATWEDIARALEQMRTSVDDGGVGVIYFAGHVVSEDGENFLVPADAGVWSAMTAAEALVRVESLWAFPRGRDPEVLMIALETQGALGMLGGRLIGSGTGLSEFAAPSNVILALSDAPGDIVLRAQAVLEAERERPWWRRWLPGPSEPAQRFTLALVETDALIDGDPVERLRNAALQVREQSRLEQSPALFAGGRPVMEYQLFRSAFEDAAQRSELAGGAPVWPSLSDTGLTDRALIKMFEGLRLSAYLDSAGIETIGYGHVGPEVRLGLTITREEAERLLIEDINEAADALDRLIRVDLNTNQRRALTSFVFNVGEAAFAESSVLEHLNAAAFENAAAEMLRWIHVHRDGRALVVPGLEGRRELESYLLLTPVQSTPPAVVIRAFEPFRAEAELLQNCRVQGYGHRVTECGYEHPDSVSEPVALDWLDSDIQHIRRQISASVDTPLSQGQMAALTSYIHDVGFEAFYRSPIRTRLNAGDYAGAANALRLSQQISAEGVLRFDEAVIHRRAAEAALFFADGSFVVTEPPDREARPNVER